MHGHDDDEVTTKCARCGVVLHPASEEGADFAAAVAAHRNRCFIVGDRVKVDYGMRSEFWGDVVSLTDANAVVRVTSVSDEWLASEACPWRGKTVVVARGDMRRTGIENAYIERPEQVQSTSGAHTPSCTYYDSVDAECTCDEENEPPSAPTLYDGLTAEQCLGWVQRRQRETTNSQHINITPSQLLAARTLWSAQLRAKQQEARERERMQVVVEQDAGDFEW